MKTFGIALFLSLALLSYPAQAAEGCTSCAGVVMTSEAPVGEAVPILVVSDAFDRSAAERQIAILTAEQKKLTTVVLRASFDDDIDLSSLETKLATFIEWGTKQGPFAAFGLEATNLSTELRGYALKRFAVAAQGQEAARAVILPAADSEALKALYATGAQAYFDFVLTESPEVREWILANDPVKKIYTIAEAGHANPLYDAAGELAAGASVAFLDDPSHAAAAALFNRELSGDFAPDNSHDIAILDAKGAPREDKAIAFVRGEDLRTLIVTPGDPAAATILSLAAGDVKTPRFASPSRTAEITDSATRNRRFLIGLRPSREPFLVTVDRPPLGEDVTQESIEVQTARGISVEEIIRNHQAYHAFQESIAPRYIARNETKLRFAAGAGEQIEATLAGDHFFDPAGRSDWVWADFYINGVKWKYGRIPELPLIQPEKVSQLPLDIHLTNDYRYELAGESRLAGYDTWEVRFEPPPDAPAELPLYRGTVWIDKKSWARVRLGMIQLNLEGEVLSNEERVDFVPFARGTHEELDAEVLRERDPKSVHWLPLKVAAQQVLSTAGRTTSVIRTTNFVNFRIEPSEYEALHQQASSSNARMVRETDNGLRYLERNSEGQRVVKEGFDTSRLFFLSGLHHDEGLEYPVVPLGGIDYFNFNLWDRGIQTNVFFAGIVLAVNATDPSFLGTRTNVGADFFGIAIATENKIYEGEIALENETIKTLPVLFSVRAGHPFLGFGKIDLTLAVNHTSFQRAETTGSTFITPTDTFTLNPGLDISYERRGWGLSTSVEQGIRTNWDEWGNGDDYSPEHDSYTRWRASVGRSFYLPKFQRLGVELNYLDGSNLDRFSKYELGFFGSQRVRGFQSGSVRAEKMVLGHLSYGFVISDQIRLEAFYDHALLDDEAAGYSREPFQGVGVAGQIVGPWGTIVRMDVGKSIGTNAQDDFVADIIVLKLFN